MAGNSIWNLLNCKTMKIEPYADIKFNEYSFPLTEIQNKLTARSQTLGILQRKHQEMMSQNRAPTIPKLSSTVRQTNVQQIADQPNRTTTNIKDHTETGVGSRNKSHTEIGADMKDYTGAGIESHSRVEIDFDLTARK